MFSKPFVPSPGGRSVVMSKIPNFKDFPWNGGRTVDHRRPSVAQGGQSVGGRPSIGTRLENRRSGSTSSHSTRRRTAPGSSTSTPCPGFPPFVRGPYAIDVRQPALDRAAVRRLLDGRGVQRLLSAQPGRRPEGPSVAFDLPTHRGYDTRQSPRRGRCRHGRRRHRQHPRHAHPLRRHPPRTRSACR